MKSKAQVSIYIMLGIVILIIFILLMQQQQPKITENPTYLDPSTAEDYVKSCLYHSGMDAYKRIGFYGGQITIPHPQYITADFNYPDYNFPSLDEITDSAKYYILSKYDDCIDEVNKRGLGFNISKNTPTMDISYTDIIKIRMDMQVRYIREILQK
ncbi:hypothetical protein K9M79_00975 [Candidatus Woesearchaeota archaeon]|nr:hypothetical protein [Candidatus Woesearchaeota archaeon]